MPPSTEPVRLQVYNLLGQLVYSQPLTISTDDGSALTVSLPNLASGWLLLRIEQGSQTWYRTLAIKK
ncbi:MAG: T9SS type A sorting domain-containing protein [Calditrichota bacterium]